MTRPRKQTVDYFPHQCNHGETMFILEQRYGNDGYAFWFKLLELLGKTEGHYLDCNKATTLNYLAAKTLIDIGKVLEILSLLAELEAIDTNLWIDNRIIWSDNFVKGLLFAYRNREVNIPDKPDNLCKKSGICGTTNVRNPQMKVNESKGNESKLIASPESPGGDNGDATPAYFCSSFQIDKTYFQKLLTEYQGLTEPILNRELNKMGDWLSDNPGKHKRNAHGHIKNPKLFIRNWIERMDIKPDGGKAWYE